MIKIISKIMKKLWVFLIALTIILIVPIITLYNGINIDEFNFSKLKISKLYIKLDKKLIVQAKNIDINFKKSENSSNKDLKSLIKKIPLLDKFFKQIDIKDMSINGNKIKLLYEDDIFYLDTKYLTIDAKLSPQNEDLKIEINSMILKDFNLKLYGTIIGDIQKREGIFRGKFKTFNISGDLVLHGDKNIISYMATTDDFSTLKPFMDSLNQKVKIEKEANDWIYKKITAKNYKISSLEGKININNGDFYPNEMKANATIKKVKVKFHKDVPPALINKLNLDLKNNTLFFDFDTASYQNIKLKKSNAHIYNLLTKGNGIVLNLFAKAPLNEDIQKILKAYKINVPILQKSGKVDTNLSLDVRFVPYDIDVNGSFHIQNSNIMISKAPFFTKNANVLLDNRLITLKDTNLQYQDVLNINSSGLFDLYKDKYDGNLTINSLHVASRGNDFLNIKNIMLPVNMKIKKDDFSIYLPSLDTSVHFLEKTNTIYQNKLSLLYKNSLFMQKTSLKEGKLFIDTKDFVNFKIDLNISDMKPIFKIKDKNITSLDLHVISNQTSTKANTKRDFLNLTSSKNNTFININKADIMIDTNSSQGENNGTTTIKGIKSNLLLTDLNKTILFSKYLFTMQNDDLIGKANYKDGNISFKLNPKFFHIQAENLNDNFVNTYINQKLFNEGKFDIKLSGDNIKNFVGHVHFRDTFLKSFSFYNNFLAFINSIPTLLSFKKPGFDEKGYSVKSADILFYRKDDIVDIYSIDIKGTNADIFGKGNYNLKTNAIDFEIQLQTLKDVSDLVGKIPMVNYIFLGKDNIIKTHIKIHGTLDNPKIETQAMKEVALSPFNIIKRTITLPFNIFD